MTRAQTQQVLRRLPAKWALAILALIVLYALTQPMLNSRLGLNLPSLARLMGEPEPATKTAGSKTATAKIPKETTAATKGKSSKDKSNELSASETTLEPELEPDEPAAAKTPASKPAQGKTSQEKSAASKPAANKPDTSKPASNPNTDADGKTEAADSDSELLYGILKETGNKRYVSAEGLQYTPGSDEGHRLKHLERHLSDMPDRPGSHGVFDGGMQTALRVIDDAYARGKRGAKGVRKQVEDGRTVYEVTFDKPIGFIGGQSGGRSGHPPAKHLRLVVEGNRFITGFPY